MVTKSKDTSAVKKIIEDNLEPEKKKVKKALKKSEADIAKKLPPVAKKERAMPIKIVPEFEPVEIVVKKHTSINWIGIFRRLNKAGKIFKIIGSSKEEKEYYKGLWERYVNWWNKNFNTVKAVPVSENLFEDIKVIPRKIKNYDEYFEIKEVLNGEKEKH